MSEKAGEKGQNLLLALIASKIRIRILGILLLSPEKEFYYREMVEQIGAGQRGAIARELKRLVESGYVLRRVSGQRKYYRINTDNPIYPELKAVWMKTVGLFAQIEKRLTPLKTQIDFAFVYGSFASGTEGPESDVDLMIVGKVKGTQVSKALSDIGSLLGREINYSVFSREEVKKRLKKGDHFWSRILGEEVVFLVGDKNEFERMGE